LVLGSSGIWPDKYTVSPTLIACEYGPIAAGAFGVEITLRLFFATGVLK